jgi:pimeloyl-ACP methyl ester carboxylesterase
LVVGLATGILYQRFSEQRDRERYSPPGKFVDVGGYQLHLHCVGSGSPAVVLDAGLGSNFVTWAAVQPQVGAFTQACSYDRAGLGWSDPGPAPRTSDRIVSEFAVLLKQAAIPGPFVLVGHSLGGLHMRLFAFTNPDAVAGLVLVDPSHEDQLERLTPTPPILSLILQSLSPAAPFGLSRMLIQQIPPPSSSSVSEDMRGMELAGMTHTRAIQTMAAEYRAIRASSDAVRRLRRPLGHLPVTVLSAGQITSGPGMSPEAAAHDRRVMRELHEQIVSSSTEGRLIVAEQSEHFIQANQPDLVVEAVRSMVSSIQRSQ